MNKRIINCCRCHSLFFKNYRILKVIFTLLASFLIGDTFYTLLVRKPTYNSYERRPLSVDDYPEMIVCPEPSTNITALTSRGYESAEHYYKGKLFANAVSWAGNKTENEETVVQEIATVKSVKDCGNVNSVHNGVPIRATYKLSRAMSPYHICCKVIPPKESRPIEALSLDIPFLKHQDSYRVFLVDPLISTILDQYNPNMLNEKIFTASNINGRKIYKIQIKEYIHLESNPKFPCKDYLIKGEYANCVDRAIIKENQKYINCTPPWMTNNENLWCKGRREFNSTMTADKYYRSVARIGMPEVKPKECLVPCRVRTFKAFEIGFRKWRNSKGVTMWFENEVKISKTSWQMDKITVLSKIGGYIGISKNFLWVLIVIISSAGVFQSYIKDRHAK